LAKELSRVNSFNQCSLLTVDVLAVSSSRESIALQLGTSKNLPKSASV
jgi:hypothetical protein